MTEIDNAAPVGQPERRDDDNSTGTDDVEDEGTPHLGMFDEHPTRDDLIRRHELLAQGHIDELRAYGFTGLEHLQPPAILRRLADEGLPPGTEVEIAKLRAREAAREHLAAERARTTLTAMPAVTSLDRLLAEPEPPIRWLVRRIWPVGARVLLYAPRKTGKTSARNELVRSLADRLPFLGQFEVEDEVGGAIAIVDTEMDRRQLRRWFADLGIDRTDLVDLYTLRGAVSSFNILDNAVRAEWAARLRERGTTVLILDCLRPVLDALALDENHDAGRFLVAFDALLAEAHIDAAAVVHHAGHGSTDRARGDSRIMDWPDVLWRLSAERVDDPFAPRFFDAFGRDVAEVKRALAHDTVTRRLTLAGATAHEQALAPACEVVLDVLRGEGVAELSARRLQTACMAWIDERDLDIPRSHIREAIDHLEVTGRLCKRAGARGANLYTLGDLAKTTE